MEVPKYQRVNTGEQELAEPSVDDFLAQLYHEALKILGEDVPDNGKVHPSFEIVRFELYHPRQEGSKGLVASNGRASYLTYHGLNLGGVLETRTEGNRVEFTYYSNLEAVLVED